MSNDTISIPAFEAPPVISDMVRQGKLHR